jgi:hypothetical protein
MNSKPQPGHERAALLDRLYQRISRLNDESLASLDELTASADRIVFEDAPDTPPHHKAGCSRRTFMLALLTGSVVVAGGATVVMLDNQRTSQMSVPAPTAHRITPTLQGEPPTPAPTASPSPDVTVTTLHDELAALRSDRIALRAQLDSARRENEQLSAEILARQNDIDYLQQVIALYEQMEATGLDNAVISGLSPVALALLTVATGRSLLTTGIQQAATRLATVEVQSPAIANGLLWLEDQINRLSSALQELEDSLSGLVEPVKPIAQQIGEFIGQVLDMLPFGVGQNIRAGLEAIAALLTHIPELVASINAQIITPLRQWVSPDEDKGLVAEVVRPISTNLINPAQGMVDSTSALETAFNDNLKTPVETAIAARAELRQTLHILTGAADTSAVG